MRGTFEKSPWRDGLQNWRLQLRICEGGTVVVVDFNWWVWLLTRAHICHKYHKLYLWRKNCHVEKFLGNFGKFWRNFGEILEKFCHNFRAFMWRKIKPKKYFWWRKNEKYEVWTRLPTLLSRQQRKKLDPTTYPTQRDTVDQDPTEATR